VGGNDNRICSNRGFLVDDNKMKGGPMDGIKVKRPDRINQSVSRDGLIN
jgi:hypothetical protein